MIIKKTDFNSWVQFTQNIEDRILNPHIQNVMIERINPILGDQLYNAIMAVANSSPVAWNGATAYTLGMYATEQAGDIPSYSDKVYRSIQAGTNHALTDVAFWELDPLATFWFNHVRPWAVFETFHRFLIWQGVNVVQYSLVFMDTEATTVIDGQTRAFIMDNVKTSAEIRKARMLNYLCDNNWKIGTVTYKIDSTDYKKETGSTRIRAVKKRNRLEN
jgi:hypothetical protein